MELNGGKNLGCGLPADILLADTYLTKATYVTEALAENGVRSYAVLF